MKHRLLVVLALVAAVAFSSAACATKKYARNTVNERVTPVEQRTGELEESSRRNSQEISRAGEAVTDVRGRADRAQSQADAAMGKANQANTRITGTEQNINELRSNLDKYTMQNSTVVNFKFNSWQLTPEAKQTLDTLAGQIRDRNNFVLEIEGFADATGSDAYNNQLTQKRAEAVRRYLAEQHNIPLYRMNLLGFGESRPVADNHTRTGRSENRRVEVRLLTRNVAGGASSQASGSTTQQQ